MKKEAVKNFVICGGISGFATTLSLYKKLAKQKRNKTEEETDENFRYFRWSIKW